MLAIAGSLAAKQPVPAGPGSFPTTGPLWVGLLIGVILIVGGLTFLPSLALGPVADHVATDRRQAVLGTRHHGQSRRALHVSPPNSRCPRCATRSVKLAPARLVRNPVMFTTGVVALLLTVLLFVGGSGPALAFQVQIVVWLWLTVLFGNFAEAIAEGRGKAQAASLRAHQGRADRQACHPRRRHRERPRQRAARRRHRARGNR